MRRFWQLVPAFVALAALAVALGTAEARATTFVNQPISQPVSESANIVRGTTLTSYMAYGPDGKRIFTYTKIDVSEVYKGDLSAGQTILVRSPGGTVDGVQMAVPGAAAFRDNEDVVLMLGPHNEADDSYDIPGLATGKYGLEHGSDGQLVIVNAMGAGEIYDSKKDPGALSYMSRIPLQVFKQIARGDKVPEASTLQFHGSKSAAPPETQTQVAHPGGGTGVASDRPPSADPQSLRGRGAPSPPPPSPWVLIAFVLVTIAGSVLLFWAVRNIGKE